MRLIGVILAFTGLIGFQTRWTLKLYIPVAFYLWAVPCFFGKLNHNQILLWIPIIFAFSQCSAVWSVDAIIKKLRKTWTPPEKISDIRIASYIDMDSSRNDLLLFRPP